MNRPVLFAAAVLIISTLSTGCSAFDFEMNETTEEVVFAGDPGAFQNQVKLPTDLIPARKFELLLEEEPARIYAQSVELELTETHPTAFQNPNPFSFIDSLEFYIRPTAELSVLPVVKLAWTTTPTGGTSVPMVVDGGLNLLPYLRQGFEVYSVLNGRVPAIPISFRGRMVMGVDVF